MTPEAWASHIVARLSRPPHLALRPLTAEDMEQIIAREIRIIQRQSYEYAAKVCAENKLLSGSPGPLFDAGWNAAIDHTAKVILALIGQMGKPLKAADEVEDDE